MAIFIGYCNGAYANFDFNSNCIKAYQSIVSLKLDEGKKLIDAEREIHPQNAIPILLDNYHDFFYLLTTENKVEFDRLIEKKSGRIELLEKEDHHSPYQNYAIAQINLQWALLHVRFGNNTAAGFEINKAFRLLTTEAEKYPGFLPGKIPLGVVNVLLGSLPGGPLKSILNILGIKGNTAFGVNTLEGLTGTIKKTDYYYTYDELVFYLTFIQSDVVTDAGAYSKMCGYIALIDSSSLLKNYIAGYVSLRTGHSTEAISWLQNRPMGLSYSSYPYLDYLLGIAKMNRGDADAFNFFNKFLKNYNGVNFIKDSFLHLAWNALLAGDFKRYRAYIQLVNTKGNQFHDRDKQAFDEANDDTPNITLLKARLLFDGGYYNQALKILNNCNSQYFELERDKIEFKYRIARIYDGLNKDTEALGYYQKTIDLGKFSTYHYAATSAVKMGLIYERRKDLVSARQAYKLVFTFANHQYKNSLEQKATEGLKRCGN